MHPQHLQPDEGACLKWWSSVDGPRSMPDNRRPTTTTGVYACGMKYANHVCLHRKIITDTLYDKARWRRRIQHAEICGGARRRLKPGLIMAYNGIPPIFLGINILYESHGDIWMPTKMGRRHVNI